MSKPQRVNNSDSSYYINRLIEFDGSNMYSRYTNHDETVYVVFSYGRHFPMWIYDHNTNQWYGNKDKFSRTTSKQQGQSRPDRIDLWFDTDMMKRIADHGYNKAVAFRMGVEA